MRKNKIICALVLCSFFTLSIGEAFAVPKNDVLAPAKTSKNLAARAEEFGQKVKNWERKVHESIIGFADKEFGPLKEKLKKLANTGGAKDWVEGAVGDVKDKIDEAEEKLQPAKDKIDEAKEAKDKIEDNIEEIGVDPKKAAELAVLQVQKEEIIKDYDDQIKTSNETYNGNISAIDQNMTYINENLAKADLAEDSKLKYQNDLAKYEDAKSLAIAEKANAEKDLNDAKTAKLKEIDELIKSLQKEIGSGLLAKGKEDGSKYFSKRDAAKAMEDVQARLFLAEGEPQTSANINRIVKNRRAQALGDHMEAMSTSIEAIVNIGDSDEEAEMLHSGTEVSEGENTSIVLTTEQIMVRIDRLITLIGVSLAQNKAVYSSALAKMSDYSVTDQDRDITKFNLDDYNYKKHCNVGDRT